MKDHISLSVLILISGITSLICTMSYDIWSSIGIGLCVFSFLNYVSSLRSTIPILELLLLMSALQWIFGAHQAYNFEFKHYKYYMYVDREAYMSIIVPGFLCFMLGVLVIKSKLKISEVNSVLEKFVVDNPKAPVVLVIIGFLSPIIGKFTPMALSFLFFLLGNLKFIGVALWLFQPENNRKWIVTFLIIFFTLLGSIQSGMFHELLLWSALLFSFIVLRTGMSIKKRLVIISFGLDDFLRT